MINRKKHLFGDGDISSLNVLITGATGMLGSNLINLLSSEYICKGISRKHSNYNIDISDYDSLRSIEFNPNVIIHSAAIMDGNLDAEFKTNELGTLNICKLAKEKSINHMIYISTISVYEKHENEYFNSYAITKRNSEAIVEFFCRKESIPLTILRFSQIYDFEGKSKKNQSMLYDFILNIQNNREISIFGIKDPVRNYIDIEYCVKIVQDALKNRNYGVFNVVNQKNHTVSEVASIIFDLFNMEPKITFLKNKENIKSIYVPSNKLYKSDFCPLPLKTGIKRILDFEK